MAVVAAVTRAWRIPIAHGHFCCGSTKSNQKRRFAPAFERSKRANTADVRCKAGFRRRNFSAPARATLLLSEDCAVKAKVTFMSFWAAAQNLAFAFAYKNQILRLLPQDDIATRALAARPTDTANRAVIDHLLFSRRDDESVCPG